jgi:uncharacterized protein
MTRLLTILAIAYFGWQFVKNYLRRHEVAQKRETERRQQGPIPVVKCQHCQLHLPENEAVASGSNWFCCDEHRSLWLKAQR